MSALVKKQTFNQWSTKAGWASSNVRAQSAPSLVKIELTDLATHYNFEKGPFTFKSREILLKKNTSYAKGLNTQNMTNSTPVSPVKMEYGWLTMLFLLLNLYFLSKFSNKNDKVRAWRNFKNIFPRPLFIIIFRPEMLKFHPYSILTGDIRVEFVIYCVLNRKQKGFFENY